MLVFIRNVSCKQLPPCTSAAAADLCRYMLRHLSITPENWRSANRQTAHYYDVEHVKMCFTLGDLSEQRGVWQTPVRLRNCNWNCCRLEVYHQNEWGTVCDDHFSNTAAQVVCAQIGCGPGGWAHGNFGYHYNRYRGAPSKIWMDDVQCRGYELSLGDCISEDGALTTVVTMRM